jgi:chemotaxis protein MotB
MKKIQKKPPKVEPGVAVWILSYADMVTLLLTFFVVLFTLATVEEAKFRKLAAEVSRGFAGATAAGMTQTAAVVEVAEPTYGIRWDVAEEGTSFSQVKIIGNKITIGGKVAFDEGSSELRPEIRNILNHLGERMRGLRGRIDIRGHANLGEGKREMIDELDLSYRRARQVRDYLAKYCGVEERKMRVAGESYYRPEEEGVAGVRPPENRRVEIVNTEELSY